MGYDKIGWKDYPDKTTPINSQNLGHMEDGIFQNSENIGDMKKIANIGDGTVAGAIGTLNTDLSSNHQWKEYTNLTTLGLDNNCTMDDILTALYNKGANSMLCMAIWKDSAPNLVLASTSNKHILTIKVVGSGYVYVSDFDVNTGIEYVRGHDGYNYTAWSSTKSIS